MNNNASLNDLLLKFSFLYTGNSRLAKIITERFINENPTYTHFSKIEVLQKLVLICRAEYKKTAHIKRAIANVVTFNRVKKSSFISKLLSFSKERKEIVLLNFVEDIPLKTISEMINMQEAKVRACIKKLELELIPYFPNDELLVKEHIKFAVKELDIVEEEKIVAVDYVKQLSIFKWISITSSIVAIMLLVGAYFYISNIQKNEQSLLAASSERLVEKDAKKGDSVENPNGSASHSESSYYMHMPDPVLYDIHRYDTFYNISAFYSNLHIKYYVGLGMIEMYYVKKNMYEHNMELSEQQVQSTMNSARNSFEMRMQDEEYALKVKQTMADFNLTEEDYIRKYLYPEEELTEYYRIMSEKEIVFDEIQELYLLDTIPPKLLEFIKLSNEEYEEIRKSFFMANWEEVVENPPGLPFNIVGSALKVSTKDGKSFIENPEYFSLDTTVYSDFYYKYIMGELGLMLTRKTFKSITEYLEDFNSEEVQDNIYAAELLELLRALERSIEWELQV